MALPWILWAVSLSTAAAPSALTLSLQAAQEKAASSSLLSFEAKGQVAEAEASRAGSGVFLRSNPRLAGDVRPGITAGTRGTPGYSANLEFLFDLPQVVSGRIAESRGRAEVASAAEAVSRVEAQTRVGHAYVGVKVLELRERELVAESALVEKLQEAADQRMRLGVGSDVEVLTLKVERSQLAAELEATRAGRSELSARLLELCDLPPATPVDLTTDVEALSWEGALGSVDDWMERAQTGRQELAEGQAHLEYLKRKGQRLNAETLPKLGLYAGVDAAPASPIFGFTGLSIELPVAQRNQRERAVNASNLATEEERLARLRRTIAREVAAAFEQLTFRIRALKHFNEQAVPAAADNRALITEGWKAGRFDVFRVTTAAREVARLRREKLESLAAVWTARLALERAAGGMKP